MSTLAERIIEARESAGLDKAGLQRAARPVKITHSALSQLESGKSRTMRAETALAIARVTGYRPEYLVLGQLPKRAGDSVARNVHSTRELAAPQYQRAAPSRPGVDIDVLRHILELMESVDEGTPAERANVIAAFYDAVMTGGETLSKTAVLKLLRSA